MRVLFFFLGMALYTFPALAQVDEVLEEDVPVISMPSVNAMPMLRTAFCDSTMSVVARKACSDKAINIFVRRHIRYPDEALRTNAEGRAVIHFEVNAKGKIDKYTLVREPESESLKEESHRMAKLMQEKLTFDIVGNTKGEERFRYMLPLNFKLH